MPHLRVAKVQNFIKKLIYEHEIAFDALLTELPAKVVLEQGNYLHTNAHLLSWEDVKDHSMRLPDLLSLTLDGAVDAAKSAHSPVS